MFNVSVFELTVINDVVEPRLTVFVDALDTFAVAAMFNVPR